jgi:hypothetical protein
VILTEEGEASISGISTPKIKIENSEISLEAKKNKPEREPVNTTPTAQIQAQNQLNTTIAINITVDTKDQASVENLLKIIKVLKGVSEIQAT